MDKELHNVVELMAYAYLRNSRPFEAEALLSAIDELVPGRDKTMKALALAQLRTGAPERALQTLERIAAAGPVEPAWHVLRAQALVACDRRIEAREAMAECLSMREQAA